VHRLAEAVLVKADAADFRKGRGFQDAGLAKVVLTFFGGIGQQTAGTMGRKKGTYAVQAGRAECRGFFRGQQDSA
jgi:hypothetical protein